MLLLERLILRLGDLVEDAIEHLDALLDLLQRPIDLRLELPTVRHRARCLTTSRRRARSSGVESVDPTRLVRGGNNERERRAAFSVNCVRVTTTNGPSSVASLLLLLDLLHDLDLLADALLHHLLHLLLRRLLLVLLVRRLQVRRLERRERLRGRSVRAMISGWSS